MMILADKIIEERKKCGWSQEDLAAQLEVSRQAVSKWESAQSVPDLQRIIRMAKLFGVTTDYLLNDEMERPETELIPVAEEESGPVRRVSMEEANTFLDMKKRNAPKLANAVSLCILSPAVLIVLAGMAEDHIGRMSEELASGIGILILFGMIAYAVFTFITIGVRVEKMEHLEREAFETEYGVSGMVREKKNAFEDTYSRGLALGVILCIVSCIPLVVVGLMNAPDYVCCIFTAVLLAIIAAGVNLIIRVALIKGGYDTLLEEGDYTRREKRSQRRLQPYASAFWLITTAGYLAWSFTTMRWDRTWIVWPVAGVLYGAVTALLRGFMKTER